VSKWKKCKMGDVIKTNVNSITANYPHKEILYLDTGSITSGKIDSYQRIPLEEIPSRARRLVNNGDIVYSTVRPIQRHYGLMKNPAQNLVVSTGFCVIEANKKLAEPMFIYNFLTMNDTVELLDSIAEGSTSAYPSLKPSDIEALDITLPSLPEQKIIAGVFSGLDDKIDLLHRQNKALEAMAEALFRQWFVEEADDAWEEGTIDQLIYIQNGFAFKSSDFKKTGVNGVIKIKNIYAGIIDIENTNFIENPVIRDLDNRFKLKTGDILIAMTGAEIGKLGIIPNTDKSLWMNQRVGLLVEKFKGAKYLAYLQLKSEFGKDYIDNTATGSAQPNISAMGIESCYFPALDCQHIKTCALKIDEIYNKVIFNLGQICTLEKFRDLLLPKLMSGEVRVKL